MGLLKLAIDWQNLTLVNLPGVGSITSIPGLFQSNEKPLRVTVVDPTGNLQIPYSIQDLAGYSMRVSVGDTPTGSSGGPTPLALQILTWNVAGKYFEGTLLLDTPAVDTFIGVASARQAYFEVNITGGTGVRDTIYQGTFQLKAVVDELTGTVPNPVNKYLTAAECLAMFTKKVGLAGETIVLKSPDGNKNRELGCNNDGSGMDDLF